MSVRKWMLSLMILLPLLGWSAVTLDLSKTQMTQDETTSLTLKVEGGLQRLPPKIPLPDGLEVRGTSRQDMTINFKRETRVVYELGATKPGTYEIGPYTLEMNDGKHEIPQLTLTVKAPTVLKEDEQLFVSFDPSAERVYVKQRLDVTLTFFSLNPIEEINVVDFQSEGFDIGDWQEIRTRNQQLNGNTYRVKRYVARMIPKQEGTYSFNPLFRVQVQVPGEIERDNSFGMFRRRYDIRTMRIQLKEPGQVEVLAPPTEGRPESFTGHVGRFQLSGSLSPEEVKVGDPMTLRIQLTERGSIREALPPRVDESADFNVYDPRLIEEDMRRDGLSGIKTMEQVIIPLHEGVTELPEISFSYFDPEREEYQTTRLGPFPLTVTPGSGTENGSRVVNSLPGGGLNQETGPNVLGEDLVYLKRSPGSLRPLTTPVPGWGIAMGGIAPLAIWGLLALGGLLKSSPAGVDSGKRKNASRTLREQITALSQAEEDQLAGQIWDILAEYLQARLDIPPGELNASSISTHLPKTVSHETGEKLLKWISRCEQARFSGGRLTGDAEEMRDDFRDCMMRLDLEVGV